MIAAHVASCDWIGCGGCGSQLDVKKLKLTPAQVSGLIWLAQTSEERGTRAPPMKMTLFALRERELAEHTPQQLSELGCEALSKLGHPLLARRASSARVKEPR